MNSDIEYILPDNTRMNSDVQTVQYVIPGSIGTSSDIAYCCIQHEPVIKLIEVDSRCIIANYNNSNSSQSLAEIKPIDNRNDKVEHRFEVGSSGINDKCDIIGGFATAYRTRWRICNIA